MDPSDELDALVETLSIEKIFVPPQTPPFDGYGGNPRCWNYWGGQYPAGNPGTNLDIEYRNAEGRRHRIYGPAYISKRYQVQEWFKEGKRHRENGPAVIHKKNSVWFYEGKLHRLDGPAVVELGGPKQYWIHGVKYSKKQYECEIKRRKRKGLIK